MGIHQWIYSDWLTPPPHRTDAIPFYPWPEDGLSQRHFDEPLHPPTPAGQGKRKGIISNRNHGPGAMGPVSCPVPARTSIPHACAVASSGTPS